MAYSRIEYLQSLNRMRNSYQTSGGNSGINTNDDSTNVGNELSSFAYMGTNIPAPEQASEGSNNKGENWKRIADTALLTSAGTNVAHGVMNFVDDVVDFVGVVGGWLAGLVGGIGGGFENLFSGGSFEKGFTNTWDTVQSGIQDFTTYDWQAHVESFINQANLIGHAVNGDMFREDGQYWKDWGNVFTSTEKSREAVTRTEKSSYAQDAEWVGKVEQGVGYILPSIVLAYFTGGSSLGAQMAIQAGVAGASAMGGGFEKATSEGADYGRALGYGATKGAISATTTAIMVGVGGAVTSQGGQGIVGQTASKVGEKVLKETGSRTAEVFATKAVEIAGRAGTTFVNSFANQAVEPYIQAIYDDGNAIAEAYGDNEKIKKYLERCASNATVSALTTVIVSAGREGVDLAVRGRDGYMANFYSQKASLAQQKVSSELRKLNRDISKGKLTDTQVEQRLAQIDRYNATVEKYGSMALDYVNNVLENGTKTTPNNSGAIYEEYDEADYSNGNISGIVKVNRGTRTAGYVYGQRETHIEFGRNADVVNRMLKLGYSKQQTDYIRSLAKNFNNNAQTSDNGQIKLIGNDGTTVEINPNKVGEFSFEQDNKSYNLPIAIGSNGKIEATPTSSNQTIDTILALGSKNFTYLPAQADMKPSMLNIPRAIGDGINTEGNFVITKEVSAKILEKPNAKEIKNFLENGLGSKDKNNYIVKSGDKATTVVAFDDDGVQKYGLVTFDAKTNKILDINVKSERPALDKNFIVPKNDEHKLLTTKLEGKDGTANVYNIKNVDYDWDIDGYSINAKPADRQDPNGGFIYSKNPLETKNLAKELPFAKLVKKFGISKSLEKTYNLKIKDAKNELAVLKWVAKTTHTSVEQVLDKFGYDSIIKKDGSVTFFNYGNVLNRGVKYRYGKTSDDYSKIIRRNVSNDTVQELQGYLSENGKGLATIEDQREYSRLIRETLSYHEVDIEHDGEVVSGVKVINKEAYAPLMKQIVSYNNKIGIKTRFALRLFDDYQGGLDIAGFYSPKNKEITLFVDTIGYGGNNGADNLLAQVNAHEIFHALSDKLHARTILSELKGLPEYPDKAEWNRLVKQYERIWRFEDDFEGSYSAEEELLANIYAGSQKMSNQQWVDEFRNKTLEIYEGGTKNANRDYYELLGKQEAEEYERDYYDVAVDKNATIGIAVTYDEPIDSETFETQIAKYKPKVEKLANPLAKALGLKIEIGQAIGGWTFTDQGSQKVIIGGEPSFPITVSGYKNIEDVKLFASILADTAFEVQNSVGVIEYTENGGSVEDTFYLTRIDDGLNEIIKNAELEGYTLYKNEKNLVVVGAENDIIDALLTELENGGYLDVNKHQATRCQADWLGIRERANLYQTRVENGVGQENGLLSSYVSKASKVNKYMVEHLAKDEKGKDYRIKGTENNASKILRLLAEKENNRPTETELIKNSANLKHTKVYDLKTTNQIVENALTNMLDKFDNAVKITIPNGKGNLKNFTFEELNLAKNMDTAVENIVDQIESAVVTFEKDANGHSNKVKLAHLGHREDLEKAVRGLLAHKGELSAKSKWVQKYVNTLHRYAGYVRERAQLTSEYVTAMKAQKTLEKIFADTRSIKIGGENIVQELTLYKKMVSGFLLSKSSKNVAPSSFTKLVNNFEPITSESYGEFYDPTIANLIEELKTSFIDGKFPDREPTLREMQLFNAVRARVLTRARELTSAKHQEKIQKAELGVKLASVGAPSVKPKTYGKIKSLADSDVSLPIYLRSYLGYDHPLVVHLSDTYMKVSANYYGAVNNFNNFVYSELLKEAGFKKEGVLVRELNKNLRGSDGKVVTFADRNGVNHKITVNEAVGAYLTYKSAKEQLLATGLTKTNIKNNTEDDFKFSDEDYQKMFALIPEKVKNWADIVFDKYYNGKDFDYKMKIIAKYFGLDATEIFKTNRGTYVNTYRVGQVNSGIGSASEFDAGYLSTMLQGFLKGRVSNKNHYKWYSATDLIDMNITKVSGWGEKAQWVEDLRIMLNTTVPSVGNHTLEYYLDKNVPEWKNTWSKYMSKIALGKPILEKKHGALERLGNVGQASVLGFNFLGSVPKQLLSDFSWTMDERATWGMWLKSIPEAIGNFFRMGSIKKELMEQNGYFIERFDRGDVIKSMLNGNLPSKLIEFVLKPMEWLDSTVVSTHGYAIARRIVNQGIKDGTYKFEKGSPEYKKEVAHVLHGLTLISQSNSDPMFMSRLRSGDVGWLERETMGRFHSDNQNKWQALKEITAEKARSSKRAKAYEDASKDEKYDEATREQFKKASERENYHFKQQYGKKVASILASLLLNGIGIVVISSLKRKITGKEEWKEFNEKEILKDVFLESTINWLPYVGTIANAIENNTDVSAFTLDRLNNVIGTVQDVIKAFETGKESDVKRAIFNLITNGLELTGVPANNIYQLFMGIWYQIDKEGSLSAQSWVKGYSSSYMKSKYTEYVNNGNYELARAQLGAWASMYSVSMNDENVLDEIVRLSKEGYSVAPSANMTSYTNDKGEVVKFTKEQATAFSSAYDKSSAQVSEMLKVEDYKKQDDENRAKMISKLYSAYRDYGKAKALGVAPNSKLAQLLYYTNGNVDMANYIIQLQKLNAITEDKNHSRKENVISAINKIKGLSKQEKLMLAYLSGYNINEGNKGMFTSYLLKIGFTRQDVKDFIK